MSNAARRDAPPGNCVSHHGSRGLGFHDCFHGGDERLPRLALLRQHAASLWHEPVETSPALTWLLDPAAFDPAAVLEAQQRGVERGEGERQPPSRARLDQLADLVAMPGTSLEQ